MTLLQITVRLWSMTFISTAQTLDEPRAFRTCRESGPKFTLVAQFRGGGAVFFFNPRLMSAWLQAAVGPSKLLLVGWN